MKLKLVLVSSLVLGMTLSQGFGNLLLNPSFEDADGGSAPLGDRTIDDWTKWGGGWYTDNEDEVHDGDFSIVRWESGSGIFQDFDATAGVMYHFSLWARESTTENLNAFSSLDLRVEWFDDEDGIIGTVIVLDQYVSGTATPGNYHELTAQNQAPVGTSYGRFLITTEVEDEESWDGSIAYDMASVIPEPGTLAMLLLGGLGLAWIRRRRQG